MPLKQKMLLSTSRFHKRACPGVEAELADGERLKLMRLRHTGTVGRRGFALHFASSDTYQDTVLPTGSIAGIPAEALDRACGLHLATPEGLTEPTT